MRVIIALSGENSLLIIIIKTQRAKFSPENVLISVFFLPHNQHHRYLFNV